MRDSGNRQELSRDAQAAQSVMLSCHGCGDEQPWAEEVIQNVPHLDRELREMLVEFATDGRVVKPRTLAVLQPKHGRRPLAAAPKADIIC
jgi:hypothetical protein